MQALINRQLPADSALKHKLDQQPGTRALLKNARIAILAKEAVQKYVRAHPITGNELHTLYRKDIAQLPKTQYKVKALVLRSQSEAKIVRTKLTARGKFARLAVKHSLLSQKQAPGWKLGWRFAKSFLPPIAAAIERAKKDKPSAPVWTPKGWWVIVVQAKRTTPRKTFKKARAGLRMVLLRQRVRAYLKELRKGDQISIGSP